MILVQAVLFIVWTALMFRTLFTIMRRAGRFKNGPSGAAFNAQTMANLAAIGG
jgi:hypothetical protein